MILPVVPSGIKSQDAVTIKYSWPVYTNDYYSLEILIFKNIATKLKFKILFAYFFKILGWWVDDYNCIV